MVWMLALGEGGIWRFVVNVTQTIYQVVLGLGGPGLFLLALADSSFLSIPEGNDVLIVVLSTGGSWGKMAYYVAMTTAGSVAGCSLLYSAGRHGGRFVHRRLDSKKMERTGELYRRWGSLAIIIPSILPPPTPFKVFVLSAGIFGVPYPRFLISVLIGRSFRYSMWGVLAVLYGTLAKKFLETHFHTIGLAVLVLMVVAALYLIMSAKKRRNS